MDTLFKDLTVIELASVLAGPSVGLFFAELGAKVTKIENPKTNGDVTRSWKLSTEDPADPSSAYYWSVNTGKEIIFLNLTDANDLQTFYDLVRNADILISNYKAGDDVKLKVNYETLATINPGLIYASVNGFGHNHPRTAYDLILQAESGFMFMNGEKNALPLKMPVALIDIIAGHQLKEAILIALLQRYKTQKGMQVSVSLFDSAIASLANQATNWLIAHQLPAAQGSLHPNIAPYGEIFRTSDGQQITFAIGSDKQFKRLCNILGLELYSEPDYNNNPSRVKNRAELFKILEKSISQKSFDDLYLLCLESDVPVGKIRTLEEVFEMPEAQHMLRTFYDKGKALNTISSIGFTIS